MIRGGIISREINYIFVDILLNRAKILIGVVVLTCSRKIAFRCKYMCKGCSEDCFGLSYPRVRVGVTSCSFFIDFLI